MAFVLSWPVTPTSVGTELICSRSRVLGSIRHITYRVQAFPGTRGEDSPGGSEHISTSGNPSRSTAGLSAMSMSGPENDEDSSEAGWMDSGEGSEDADAAFPADLCDVAGLGCMEDGSPPKNADQTLGPAKSFARSVTIDQAVTLVNYGEERTSTIRDESVPI